MYIAIGDSSVVHIASVVPHHLIVVVIVVVVVVSVRPASPETTIIPQLFRSIWCPLFHPRQYLQISTKAQAMSHSLTQPIR